MITGNYRELFSVIAGTAASLTGLLFVAISLAPTLDPDSHEGLIQQIRTSAAYLAFLNALVISIFALVPGDNAGYPATLLGVVGVVFTAAAVRSLLAGRLPARLRNGQIGLMALLLLTFGLEILSGIGLLIAPHNAALQTEISHLLLVSLVIGVARSWGLVGHRQPSLFASITHLRAHDRKPP